MKTRLYSIVNQYISGIHAGIQTAHAVHELFVKYPQGTNSATNLLWDWAVQDKTIIVLEGGYQSNLERIFELAKAVKSLPSAKFHEEQAALNGALTAITIVLPEYMYAPQYDTMSEVVALTNSSLSLGGLKIANQFKDLETGNVLHNYTQPEKNLIEAIKGCRLKGA
ncbi:hypothetical protein pEaSNUABM56_00236 [Erwinia phage pEa_SNUABM_56]|uniref:Uncharacterized protein n=1 Tax=Erwinia phage pEp_SNUABM_01 TaxID=2601643 RepID=A0A5J6DAU6_9CAUD|nr:hydrolase [Erwinia phage pEp_SNUABM_01]QEQ95012.1 hypothetical protein pEpSNUABM01_186 [Erwinia phage pEp_SNUABM_01]UYL84938.1 hypothetical protein pEaSNUABM55_00165 [Erwinia phage pEa_SNUABM_55]UYL85256.1 hypothetical protein pEaSNUABM56_00236 [Erwinia phage pEa_SNUABM_56]